MGRPPSASTTATGRAAPPRTSTGTATRPGQTRRAAAAPARPVRASSLAQQVEELLARRLRSDLQPGDQLPPEHELAAELMVSRATIRSAVAALARRGLVMRRQGVGTFVSEAARLSNPLSEAIDFNHLIAAHGAQPGVSFVEVERRTAADLADVLNLRPDAPVLRFTKVFTADGQPIVHAVNTLPTTLLGADLEQAAQARPEITEPLFDFLDGRPGLTTRYQLTSISAAVTRAPAPVASSGSTCRPASRSWCSTRSASVTVISRCGIRATRFPPARCGSSWSAIDRAPR